MMNMRPFIESDWHAFAGADGWGENESIAPLIGEGVFKNGVDFTLILAHNGGTLITDDETAAYGGYVLPRYFDTVEEARAFAESLGEPESIDVFLAAGFQSQAF
jgi:hypothetical protein